MYNLRARARATLTGSAWPQTGMGAHVSPALASQVNPTQATETLELEFVPETEMSVFESNFGTDYAEDVVESVEATQPPTPIQQAPNHTTNPKWNFTCYSGWRQIYNVRVILSPSSNLWLYEEYGIYEYTGDIIIIIIIIIITWFI